MATIKRSQQGGILMTNTGLLKCVCCDSLPPVTCDYPNLTWPEIEISESEYLAMLNGVNVVAKMNTTGSVTRTTDFRTPLTGLTNYSTTITGEWSFDFEQTIGRIGPNSSTDFKWQDENNPTLRPSPYSTIASGFVASGTGQLRNGNVLIEEVQAIPSAIGQSTGIAACLSQGGFRAKIAPYVFVKLELRYPFSNVTSSAGETIVTETTAGTNMFLAPLPHGNSAEFVSIKASPSAVPDSIFVGLFGEFLNLSFEFVPLPP